MFWTKPFILFYFFAQIPSEGLSQSTVSADIPRNVKFTIPKGSTTLQTSTITSSTITSSELPSDQLQPTVNISQGTDSSVPTLSLQNNDLGAQNKPVNAGAIAGLVVSVVVLLLGTLIGAVWYSRLRGRNKSTVMKTAIENQSEQKLPPTETISKETIQKQETQTVEPTPKTTPAPNFDKPSQEAQRRLRSSFGGL
ncbi:hypothetical protein TWF192_003958 [Orbilia oligospora]|uniref:Mid2 domain-containing protein n=1 Tax=Orbilia oligospora TaxID=2813651 RepID=A0A6G1MMU5_ORBOL|nr:hypothetical protein TWF679_010355 [Orbilia oligospora]KAF3221618.1 hypothetical protein TWF191_007121 [Orbilia oligospora]KAF3264270.1 hypothetical protein TWF192_003958 [Orbilia oligospora]